MSLTLIIAVLKARRAAVLGVMAVVISVVLLMTATTPKRYLASASVIVDMGSPDPVNGATPQALTANSYISTQVDVLESTRVAKRVVGDLKLASQSDFTQRWQKKTGGRGAFEDWAAQELQKSLEVKPSRGSNVIVIACRTTNADFSAACANSFAENFLATTIDLRTNPALAYKKSFDARAQQLRDRMTDAQAKLLAVQQKTGIYVNDERLDIETARLNELSTQLVMMQAAAAQSSSREAFGSRNPDRSNEVLASPAVQAMTSDLSRQRARLRELNQRLGDNHPQVAELRANITELETALAAQTQKVTGSLAIDNSVNQSRLAQMQASIDAQRNRVASLRQQREQVGVLQQDVDNAQRAYNSTVNRVDQSDLESRTNIGNVSILERASSPLDAVSPKLGLSLMLAVALSVLVAIPFALILEFRNRRIRTTADMEQLASGLFLGTVPTFKGLSKEKRLAGQRRLDGPVNQF